MGRLFPNRIQRSSRRLCLARYLGYYHVGSVRLFSRLARSFQEDSMRPKTRNALIVVILCGLVLGELLYWEVTGSPNPVCGGCYRYNASGCPVYPCPGREGLNLEASQVNSPTNVTLNIRDTGVLGITLESYIVKDSVGNQYTKMNWTSLFVNPNQVAAINIVIDGNAFTFQSRYSYTVTLVTSRSNQFSFTITA